MLRPVWRSARAVIDACYRRLSPHTAPAGPSKKRQGLRRRHERIRTSRAINSSDYSSYIRSFIRIRDERVDALVTSCLDQGRLWPDPLIQPQPVLSICRHNRRFGGRGSPAFRVLEGFSGKDNGEGKALRLYQHQADAIRRARAGRNYVLTTGTGSGKSLAYIVPIVDHILRTGSGTASKPSSSTR